MRKGDVVWWIIILGVVAILCIAVALYRVRTRYRRGSQESASELAGTWEGRNQAAGEAERLKGGYG